MEGKEISFETGDAQGVVAEDQAAGPPNFRALAQIALAQSDITVVRCASAGVAVPAEWQAYRVALRAIVASGAGPLPVRPAWPVGS